MDKTKDNSATPLLSNNNAAIIINHNNDSKIATSPAKPNIGFKHEYLEDNALKSEQEVRFEDFLTPSKEPLKNVSYGPAKPKLPDGGWGWMVVFASLVISMIADGISFSFGLLYIEFLYEFDASKSATSWIGSLFMAVPLLTGPIMSAFVDRYGCRLMTIVGGLISGAGFVLSYYVQSITICYLTFGVIAGLGLGLCYVTAVVSIAFWFDKKRNLAIGLGACGTGIGTFVYAPMTQYFISEYGWRGCVLLLAGTFLNMCVCGCLMRDPDWMIEENKLSKASKRSSASITSVSGKSFADDFPDIEELRNMLKTGENNEYLLQSLVTSMGSQNAVANKNIHRSDFSLPTFVKQNEQVPLEVLEQLSSNRKLYNVILENYPSLLSCRSTSDNRLNKLHEISENDPTRVPITVSVKLKKTIKVDQNENVNPEKPEKKLVHQQSLPTTNKIDPLSFGITRKCSLDQTVVDHMPKSENVGWLFKQLGTNTHNNFRNIRLHRNSMYRGAMLNIHKYHLRASSCPNIYRNSIATLAHDNEDKWYTEWVGILKDMVDFSMFTELHFLFMAISTILLFTWFIVPYFYLAKLMTTYYYTESEASVVISIIGITNAIGMVALGWAGDQPWTNVSKTYGVCLILCGLCTAAMYLFVTYYYLLVISCLLFGLFFASTFSFTPMILADLVPLDRFTIGYGLILLCQGIGNLIGPPIAGLLFDITQQWEQSFMQAGLWIVISGVFILGISYTENRKIIGTGPLEMERGSEADSVA